MISFSAAKKLPPDVQSPNKELAHPNIWAFGGGKGGIGKSFLSTNVASCLALMGYTVTLVDLDLGGANVHTWLGKQIPTATLSDFINKRVSNISDLIVESQVKNLNYVSGAGDNWDIADINTADKNRLLESVKSIKSDFIFLDLGAGTDHATLDFFTSATKSVVITTPEPPAIENAYRFIKSAFYRKIRVAESSLGIQSILDEAMKKENNLGLKTPAKLINHICTNYPEIGASFKEKMEQFNLQLLVNQTRTRADIELAESMKSICQLYFGVPVNSIGHISYDNAVWQSVRKRRPLVLEFPYNQTSASLFRLAKNLVDPKPGRSML